MGLEFLARIQRTSLFATAMVSLFAAVYFSYMVGIAVAAGAFWSLANLRLLEGVVTSLTGGRHSGRNAMLAGLANLALLAVGGLMLVKLPVLALAAGFTVPFAVIVLKAASQALLASAFWKRLVRSPWQASALVLALAVATWFGGRCEFQSQRWR